LDADCFYAVSLNGNEYVNVTNGPVVILAGFVSYVVNPITCTAHDEQHWGVFWNSTESPRLISYLQSLTNGTVDPQRYNNVHFDKYSPVS